jgi:uncharacterized protein (UPF0332 family)
VITNLPEQLIAQAESLLRNGVLNEANVRRAVSSAYYALFHLLVRDAVVNWKHADQHARLARAFDHKRMKDASTAILKEIGNAPSQATAGGDAEQTFRFRLSTVAQAFVDLQQARHKADYDIGEPFQPLDAAVDVAQARLAFVTWAEVRDEPLAQHYLYSLLFKDRS